MGVFFFLSLSLLLFSPWYAIISNDSRLLLLMLIKSNLSVKIESIQRARRRISHEIPTSVDVQRVKCVGSDICLIKNSSLRLLYKWNTSWADSIHFAAFKIITLIRTHSRQETWPTNYLSLLFCYLVLDLRFSLGSPRTISSFSFFSDYWNYRQTMLPMCSLSQTVQRQWGRCDYRWRGWQQLLSSKSLSTKCLVLVFDRSNIFILETHDTRSRKPRWWWYRLHTCRSSQILLQRKFVQWSYDECIEHSTSGCGG